MDYMIWEFFEGLDEMVYVTDMETNDLVFINRHFRNMLNIQSPDEYKHKKCYQLLQGRDAPCAFCTNKKLVPGEFLTWTHTNPVLNKNFLVKDTVVEYQGKRYRVEIAIDRDAKLQANAHYYARTESILNECLNKVVSVMDPEEAIQNVLAFMGETFQCDRSFVCEMEEPNLLSTTYEWCGENVQSKKELCQNEELVDGTWWVEQL